MSIEFDAALKWQRAGYNVVPRKAVDRKYPGIKWKGLQSHRVTTAELNRQRRMFENGVGFITGAISGIIVIETDGLAGETVLDEFEMTHGPIPETLTVRSGSKRGFHRHFKHPGHRVKTTANINIKVDVRGDGGFCVLPPSLHKSGGRYEVVLDVALADLPEGLIEFLDMKEAVALAEISVTTSRPLKGERAVISDGPGLLDDIPAHVRSMEHNIEPTRAPPSFVEMRAMLQHLASKNYFARRDGVLRDNDGRISQVGWREAGMALKPDYGDKDGQALWGITHIDEQAHKDAPEQWKSFSNVTQAGHVTIGTIIKAAKDAGFTSKGRAHSETSEPSTMDPSRFTGRGGDEANGKLFASMYREKLLHVHETGEWLLYNSGQGWQTALPGEADRAAKAALAKLRHQAAERYKASGPDDPIVKRMMAHVARTSDAPRLHAMIDMAKSEPGMTVQLSDFDCDPMLLGLTNGVLDLGSGSLLPITPVVLVSKRCNVAYDPDAKCPRFEQFMREVQPAVDIRLFLRRFMGYCLTGSVSEQMLAFFHGNGFNGKSVFIELFAWLLGDYARKIPTEMLMQHQRNPQGPSPDIVSLKGMRFVYANETEEGRRLAEARVKDLTGGDTLTGRVPYGKADITFSPTHKLIVVGNHKPEITDTSHGMWRRVALTPFDQTIPKGKRDPRLLEKLKVEGPGILNWMLAGLRSWLVRGLQVPKAITAATAAYREEQDILGDWISANCNTGVGCSAKKSDLYSDYQYWAKQNGHQPLAQGRLTRRLNERGYRLAADKRTIHGLGLSRSNMFGRNT